MSKCEFVNTSLVYLSYNLGGCELKIDPSKVEVIVNFPNINNVIDVRSFLGASQYWRNFIVNFSFTSFNKREKSLQVGRKGIWKN